MFKIVTFFFIIHKLQVQITLVQRKLQNSYLVLNICIIADLEENKKRILGEQC